jgi:hypothetical protein
MGALDEFMTMFDELEDGIDDADEGEAWGVLR